MTDSSPGPRYIPICRMSEPKSRLLWGMASGSETEPASDPVRKTRKDGIGGTGAVGSGDYDIRLYDIEPHQCCFDKNQPTIFSGTRVACLCSLGVLSYLA